MSIEQKSEKINVPDWSIEELYRKAWQIVKNNKLLWLFAAAAGGGISFNNSFNFGNNDLERFQKLFENKTVPEPDTITRVLGTATDSMTSLLSYAFSAVPIWFYIILFLELLFLLVVFIATSVIYQAWAHGSLLDSIRLCIEGGKANIRTVSENAFSYIKPLIFLQIIPGLVLALAFILGFIIAGILIIALDGTLKIVFGLVIFLLTIAAFIAFLLLTLTQIWAPRLVVTEKLSGMNALKKGYIIARKKFWASLLLGIVNNMLLGIIILALVFVVAVPAIVGIFIGKQIDALAPVLIILAVFFGLSILILLPIGAAILNAFKATVWSLAYTNIKGKYDK